MTPDRNEAANVEMVPLVVAARALGYRTYAEALNAIIAGVIPGERVRGRWYVPRLALDAMLSGYAL